MRSGPGYVHAAKLIIAAKCDTFAARTSAPVQEDPKQTVLLEGVVDF